MAALAHLAFGFAAKPLAPKVPLGILLVATEVNDILWGVFQITGIERSASMTGASPLSHGLFMSVVWSVVGALVVACIYRDRRSGMIAGVLVFSHWALDLITHPMGAIFGGSPLLPDLPLFFNGSPLVGLGLYNHSFVVAVAIDCGILILGVALYIAQTIKKRKTGRENKVGQMTESL